MIRFMPWNIIITYTATKPQLSASELAAAKVYEERVRLTLNAISRTLTGKALLQSTLGKEPIWIVPYSGRQGYCNANTGPFYSERLPSGRIWEYEGVKLAYSPERFATDDCGWYPGQRADEVLFHELVHASRSLNNPAYRSDPLYLMGDYEEFFAVLVTNMYRTELGATTIHREYVLKELVSIRKAEAFLSSRREYITALEYFLDEPLVQLLQPIQTPFHPFRDFNRIKSAYNSALELWGEMNLAGKINEQMRIERLGEKLDEMMTMSQESSSKVIKE